MRICEFSKSKIWRVGWQTGPRKKLQFEPKDHPMAELLFQRMPVFILLRPSIDYMRHRHPYQEGKSASPIEMLISSKKHLLPKHQ